LKQKRAKKVQDSQKTVSQSICSKGRERKETSIQGRESDIKVGEDLERKRERTSLTEDK
jgi:hypothetical protein